MKNLWYAIHFREKENKYFKVAYVFDQYQSDVALVWANVAAVFSGVAATVTSAMGYVAAVFTSVAAGAALAVVAAVAAVVAALGPRMASNTCASSAHGPELCSLSLSACLSLSHFLSAILSVSLLCENACIIAHRLFTNCTAQFLQFAVA